MTNVLSLFPFPFPFFLLLHFPLSLGVHHGFCNVAWVCSHRCALPTVDDDAASQARLEIVVVRSVAACGCDPLFAGVQATCLGVGGAEPFCVDNVMAVCRAQAYCSERTVSGCNVILEKRRVLSGHSN